jgi:hypothetical protein
VAERADGDLVAVVGSGVDVLRDSLETYRS